MGAFFTAGYFPGIPNPTAEAGDNTTQFADESVALVVLEPGVYTLAISANADRTDVNDDDGCSVFVGTNPRDFFATKIADFQRSAGAAGFTGNQYIENQIEVVVPVRGAYPFRLVHWQQGRGANLQFYMVNTNTTGRYLINDKMSDPTTRWPTAPPRSRLSIRLTSPTLFRRPAPQATIRPPNCDHPL